jgi:hypothetical protein
MDNRMDNTNLICNYMIHAGSYDSLDDIIVAFSMLGPAINYRCISCCEHSLQSTSFIGNGTQQLTQYVQTQAVRLI